MRSVSCLGLLLAISILGCSGRGHGGQGGQGKGNTGNQGSGTNNKSGQNEPPPPPCHPGCFPAGTLVETPNGPAPIESIGPGDEVILVAADGLPTSGPVRSVFQTPNVLVELETESARILTTQTQPFLLSDGGLRPAGELKSGDLVWRWENGRRRAERVRGAQPTKREAQVHNLVVGDSAVFIAGGFLVRGKPPLDVGQAAQFADQQ